MKQKQKQFTLNIPEEVLGKLREESAKTGISIAGLIKIRLRQMTNDRGGDE